MTKKMTDEWRKSVVVPIYKNKGDIQNYTNYCEIKLMSHTMKLWERVMEQRLKQKIKISENQFGFMQGLKNRTRDPTRSGPSPSRLAESHGTWPSRAES